MTHVSDEIRTRYKALHAKAEAALKAAAPARKAYDEAMAPYRALEEQIEDLVEGYVRPCEGCDEFIFEGDKSADTTDGVLCAKCAPHYSDMLANPEHFMGEDDEPMTAAEAQRICDAHVAAGGSLEDSMAS